MEHRKSRAVRLSAVVLTAIGALVVVDSPAVAVSGLVIVTAISAETGSQNFKGANPVCPAGRVILGGGADIVNGGHSVHLGGINPAPLGLPANSIWATANEDAAGTSNSWYIRAWAICGTGVTGHQIVSAIDAPPAGSTFAAAQATCPAGKKVIGAGGRSGATPSYVLDTMDILGDLSGVYVETIAAESPTPGTAPLAEAYAICVDPVPGQQLVSAATGFTSSDKAVSITCPSGTRVHGVGGGITGALGQAHIDQLSHSGSTGARIDAREDVNGHSGTWMVSVFAVCAA